VHFRFEGAPAGLALALITRPGFTRHGTTTIGSGEPMSPGVMRVPSGSFQRLCASPCEGSLPPGIHTFGLVHPDRDVWVALPPLSLRLHEPVRIEGRLVDNADSRLGGGLFLAIGGLGGLGGILAGMVMMMSSMDVLNTLEGNAGMGITIGSGVLMLVAMAVGLPLSFSDDRAWVVAFPLE
jgi:hypothetical protein